MNRMLMITLITLSKSISAFYEEEEYQVPEYLDKRLTDLLNTK